MKAKKEIWRINNQKRRNKQYNMKANAVLMKINNNQWLKSIVKAENINNNMKAE
jgi:hypothetical protein